MWSFKLARNNYFTYKEEKNENKRIFLAFLLLAVFSSAASGCAATYYVAKNGSDSNPGTEAQPWLTIQKAANTVQAGDTIYVKQGTYNEHVTLTTSGSASQGYITFQNYGTDEVILDGTGFKAVIMFNCLDVSYVKIIGFHIQNYNYGGIHITLSQSGGNYEGHVEIRNCEVEGQYFTDEQMALPTRPFGRAIAVKNRNPNHPSATASVFIVDNNVLHDNVTYQGQGGVALDVTGNVRQVQITNNYLYNNTNIGIMVGGRQSPGLWPKWFPHECIVKDNIVTGSTGVQSSIIYLDCAYNIVIENNVAYSNNGYGIVDGCEEDGTTMGENIIRHNIIYSNGVGILAGGSGDIEEGPWGEVNNSVFVHNTLYNNWNAAVPKLGDNCNFKNNIFHRGPTGNRMIFQLEDSGDFYFDYNCEYTNASCAGKWKWKGGTQLTGFSSWKSTSGQDQHSTCADPKFVDPANADFTLQSDSPCIDTGDFLTTTTNSGTGTGPINMADARYFYDGFGMSGEQGDLVQIGSNDPVRVTNVDYNTNTITVDQNISWNANDGVSYPYSGSKPDIGAYEYEGKKAEGEKLEGES